MPLIRRIPKRGFNNAAFKTRYAIINVSDLDVFEAGTLIDELFLRQNGLIRGRVDGVKILGNGDLAKSFTVKVAKVSGAAREKIEKAGGGVTAQ